MASLDDVVTVQKNGVVAVNSLVQSLTQFKTIYESFVGNNTYLGVSADSLIVSGRGRLVNVSVIAGASGGKIYDVASVANASDSNAIFTIPSSIGVTAVNFSFFNGLVIKPASGSVISISYSAG